MIELYETRTMLGMLEDRKPVRTFILDTFFNRPEVTFNTEAVDIDIIKGRRRLAPFVNPKRQGKLVEKRGFISRTFKPAYVKPKMITTTDEIFKRHPGNTIYSPNSGPAILAAAEMGKNFAELDEMITRREEWMAVQGLLTGEIPVKGEGVDVVLGFHMEATHLPVLTGGDLWSAPTTATPITDLKTWKRIVAKDSGISPSLAIMGLGAIDAFMKCEEVIGTTGGGKNIFNMLRVNMGQIEPRLLPNGVTYYGTLNEIGLDIYTYEEWYIDDVDEVEYALIPSNKVLLGNPVARCEKLYGAIKDLGATAPVPRFPKTWEENDPSERIVMLQSSPLPAPLEIDAFLTATVL